MPFHQSPSAIIVTGGYVLSPLLCYLATLFTPNAHLNKFKKVESTQARFSDFCTIALKFNDRKAQGKKNYSLASFKTLPK